MIKFILNFVLLLALSFNITTSVQATHIVGGELYYNYLGNNQYEIIFDYYIDCLNGHPPVIAEDSVAWFGVYDGLTNERIEELDQLTSRMSPIRVSDVNYNCIITKPNACVDKYQYRFTIELPPKEGGYIIVHQRCCRNGTINNLVDPWKQGSSYFTVIEDTETRRNNAAQFKGFPPNFLCINAPLVFDHSAVDADGDSLVYELYQPFGSFIGSVGAQLQDSVGPGPKPQPADFLPPPFTPVTWSTGYNTDLQINTSASIIINRKTGLLNFTPTQVGQFVVGICVKEYRQNKLINITRRDFQFNVSHCQFEVIAAFSSSDKSCEPDVSFANYSYGSGSIDYKWDFGVADSTTSKTTERHPTYTYNTPGTYDVKLVVKNGICADSYSKPVTIFKTIKPNLGPDVTLRCETQVLKLDAGNGVSYVWQDGRTARAFSTTQPGTYSVTVEDRNGCHTSDTMIAHMSNEVFSPDQHMPNTFTPNNDGLNDYYPENQYNNKEDFYSLQIFNRWGEKIATYDSPEKGWDGKYKGQMQKEGVYIYLINWKGCDGNLRYKKGNITLLR